MFKSLRIPISLCIAGCLLFASGCDHSQKALPGFETGDAIRRAGPPPTYPDICSHYNQRVEKLSSFWSRADLKLEYLNKDGKLQSDEAEATIQFELPRNFSFMISKVGDHAFTLGSDADQYWWIDRKVSPPTVVFGRHDLATRAKVAALELPMLPLEVVDCLGVTPLPSLLRAPPITWSPLKNWVIFRLPARANPTSTVEYWLDPINMDPGRIRIFDAAGKETIDCWHEVPALVKVGTRLDDHTRIASKIKVFVPERQTKLTISLNSMENRSLKGSKAFNLTALRAAYRINRDIDLDKSALVNPPASPASSPGVKK